MYENLKKMSVKAKKKLKNENFFLEVCLMELDKARSSIVFQVEYCTVASKTILATILCHRYCVIVNRYRNSVSIPLKIVGIVSVSYRFKKAGIAHPY